LHQLKSLKKMKQKMAKKTKSAASSKKAKDVVDAMIEDDDVEREPGEDDNGDVIGDGDEDEEFEDDYGDEEEREPRGDGLADMMSKILNQKVGDKVPVLAKRKTTEMKELEGRHEDVERIKRQRVEKRAEREKQLVVPDHTSADFEKQLRKLATRGVVALFNAVAKSKKEAAEKEEAEKAKVETEADHDIVRPDALNVKQMSDDSFLDMLKGAPEAASSGAGEGGAADKTTKGKGAASSSSGSSSAGSGGVTWSALRDDYPLSKGQGKGKDKGSSVPLKNWDQDDSSDDEAAGADGNDEMEGGLRMAGAHSKASSGGDSGSAKKAGSKSKAGGKGKK
jgi:hypothetical protein